MIIRHLESLPKKRSSGYHLKKKKTSEPRISLLRESLDTQGELIGVLVLSIRQILQHKGTKRSSSNDDPCCTCLQGWCVRYGTHRGIQPVYTAGITGTGHFGKFGTTSIIPVLNISVSSVRHGYRYRRYRYRLPASVQTFMPVPDTSLCSVQRQCTSVSSVQHQYR